MPTAISDDLSPLLDEAPFVAALARALIGHDADDAVQETWLRVVEREHPGIRRPRRWLASVLRGVAHNMRRQESRRRRHEAEAAIPASASAPPTVRLAERQERRLKLMQAVAALPREQREVVLLRYFENRPPRAIATRIGVPTSTVNSRLRSAHEALRQRLDRRTGDCRAWLAPIAIVYPETPAQSGAAAAMSTWALASGSPVKSIAIAAAAAVTALLLWPGAEAPVALPETGSVPLGAPMTADADASHPPRAAALAPRPTEAPSGAARTTGTVTVAATYAAEAAPVPDLLVLAFRPDASRRHQSRRARTDALGVAKFADLAPGRWLLTNRRNSAVSAQVEVRAGKDRAVSLVLPEGVTVSGLVVDRVGSAVPGAEVHLAGPGILEDAEYAATTDDAGRFALRACPGLCLVGARAAGHSPSRMHLVFVEGVGRRELRIELPGAGGSLAGRVLDPERKPVAAALVTVGESGGHRQDQDAEGNLRPIARTDRHGRFSIDGIALGDHPVQVRAPDLAPWTGSCRVRAGAAAELEVELSAGVSVNGSVVDAAGQGIAGATVELGTWTDFDHVRGRTDGSGAFALHGLPAGELTLRARHNGVETAVHLQARPGDTLFSQLILSAGGALRGRVLDEAGRGVPDADLSARNDPTDSTPRWRGNAQSDAEGFFSLPDCPRDQRLTITASAAGFLPAAIEIVATPSSRAELRLTPGPPASVRIAGSLAYADGRPVPQVMIDVIDRRWGHAHLAAGNEAGAFDIGPLPPGEWGLELRVPDQPRLSTGFRALGAGEEWQLGQLRLPPAGFVRASGDVADATIGLTDHTMSRWFAVRAGANGRSEPLAPGDYFVSVRGDGVAARMIPVSVRAGEESTVPVAVETGHRCKFVVESATPLRECEVRIHDGQRLVAGSSRYGRLPGAIARTFEHWLAAGRYVVTVRANGRTGQAAFTVVGGEPCQVAISLR